MIWWLSALCTIPTADCRLLILASGKPFQKWSRGRPSNYIANFHWVTGGKPAARLRTFGRTGYSCETRFMLVLTFDNTIRCKTEK